MTYTSLSTVSQLRWTEQDRLNSLHRSLAEAKVKLRGLKKATKYTTLEERYDVWEELCVDYDYEGVGISLAFPKFLNKYDEIVEKHIRKQEQEIKRLTLLIAPK